jgi:hypothetical protein
MSGDGLKMWRPTNNIGNREDRISEDAMKALSK